MRIDSIFISGFGIFAEQSFADLSPHCTLLYGMNETGKTTLLEFLKRVLFGFPTKRKINQYDSVKGGPYGGRITLYTDKNERLILERMKNLSPSGEITGPDGTKYFGDYFRTLMPGVDLDFFERVCAFGNEDLHKWGTLSKEDGLLHIHAAALSGLGPISPVTVLSYLKTDTQVLYTLRGKKPSINSLFDSLRRIQGQIQEQLTKQDEYDRIGIELNQNFDLIKKLGEEIEELKRDESSLTRQLQARPKWIIVDESSKQLVDLLEINLFPDDGTIRLEHLENEMNQVKDRLDEIVLHINQKEAEFNGLVLHESILEAEPVIRSLIGRLSEYRTNKASLTSLEEKVLADEREFDDYVTELGTDWNEDRLLRCDLSISTREELFLTINTLDTIAKKTHDLDSDISWTKEELKQLKDETKPINEDLVKDYATIHDLAGRARYYRGKVDRLNELRMEDEKRKIIIQKGREQYAPGWDEAQVKSFNLSETARKEADLIRMSIHQYEDAFRVATQEGESLKAEKRRLFERGNRLRNEIAGLKPDLKKEDIENERDTLDSLREYQNNLLMRTGNQVMGLFGSISVNSPLFKIFGLIITLLLGVEIILIGIVLQNIIPALISGLIVATLSGYIFISFHKMALEHNTTISGLQSIISQLSDRLRFDHIPDQAELRQKERELQNASDRLNLYQAKVSMYNDITRDYQIMVQSCKKADEQKHVIQAEFERARNAWKYWLARNRLTSSQTCEEIPAIFSMVQAMREAISTIRSNEPFIISLQSWIEKFSEDTKVILQMHHVSINEDEIDLQVERLATDADTDERIFRENADTKRRIEEREEWLLSYEKDLMEQQGSWHSNEQTLKDKLEKIGISSDTPRTIIIELLDRITKARAILHERDDRRAESASIKQYLSKYEEEVDRLCQFCDQHLLDPTPDQMTLQLGKLLEEQIVIKTRMEDLKRSLSDLTHSKELLEIKCVEYSRHISALFIEGGARTAEEFRQRGSAYNIRKQLLQKIHQKEEEILEIMGRGESIETTMDLLASIDPVATQNTLFSIQEQIRASEEEKNTQREQSGRLRERRDNLELQELLLEARQNYEVDRATVQEQAKKWTVFTVAHGLLEKTIKMYERERQPALIREAEKILFNITGGAYSRVYLPIEGNEYLLETDKGQIMDPSILSHGSAEQLYLALRLGFILNRNRDNEKLPLIFDDILVSCDEKRLNNAVQAICEVAKETQVLYFTCHPEVRDAFLNADKNVVMKLW